MQGTERYGASPRVTGIILGDQTLVWCLLGSTLPGCKLRLLLLPRSGQTTRRRYSRAPE
jgi:hypothetical protein